MSKVMGQDPTGEREEVYDYLEALADERERNERGRGLSNIIRQMNYVETHHLPAVAEKYGALIKKVLGRRRWSELVEEQKERMGMDSQRIARELVAVAESLTAAAMNYGVSTGKWHAQVTVQRMDDLGDKLKVDGLVSFSGIGSEQQTRFKGLVLSRWRDLWARDGSTGNEFADNVFDTVLWDSLSSNLDDLLEQRRERGR